MKLKGCFPDAGDARAFAADLAHRAADCDGPAAAWARVWRVNDCPRDARFAGKAAFVDAAAVAADVRALRRRLADATRLVVLLTPDAWDPANAAPAWAAVLAKIPERVRAAMSARVAAVNAAVADACAASDVAVVDRDALLRPGDVQEHTHLSRRAQVAVAHAVLDALGLPVDDGASR